MTTDDYNRWLIKQDLKIVNQMLNSQYGITSDDCGEEIILLLLKDDKQYQEIVDHIAQKYDLKLLGAADEA